MSVLDGIRAGYQDMKEGIAGLVIEAEKNLPGKTGKEKREWVARQIADRITLPWWAETLQVDYWGAKIIIGQICDRLHLLTDGDFANVTVDPSHVAAITDIPKVALMAACAASPITESCDRQATVDERFRSLIDQYGLTPSVSEELKTAKAALIVTPKEDAEKWDKILSFILKWEGGYINDPDDAGGKTNRGITEATLAAAYAQGIAQHCDISKVTKEDAGAIYKARYYDCYGYGTLPFPVALALTDSTVNSGRGGAARITQRACVSCGEGIEIDGKWGPKTQAAVEALAARLPEAFTRMLLLKRKNFYDDLVKSKPVREKFRNGWYNRLRELSKAAGVTSPA